MRGLCKAITLLLLCSATTITILSTGGQQVNDKAQEPQLKEVTTKESTTTTEYIQAEEAAIQEPKPEVRPLTRADYERLYTTRMDERKQNPDIVELTSEEAMIIMQIARCEAGDDMLGEMWTMRTILNRITSDKFEGDTLIEILTVPDQFKVYTSGNYKTADVNATTHLALAEIEKGWDETKGAVYWESSTNTENSWHKRNLTFIAEINGQRYYR
jgi:hypothetical protein